MQKMQEISIPGSTGVGPSGEGNGTPLQYSCLENSMDRGVWWALVHVATKSRTQLSGQRIHALSKLYPVPFCWKPSPEQRWYPSSDTAAILRIPDGGCAKSKDWSGISHSLPISLPPSTRDGESVHQSYKALTTLNEENRHVFCLPSCIGILRIKEGVGIDHRAAWAPDCNWRQMVWGTPQAAPRI